MGTYWTYVPWILQFLIAGGYTSTQLAQSMEKLTDFCKHFYVDPMQCFKSFGIGDVWWWCNFYCCSWFFFGGWWFEPLWKIVVTWDDYSHILWKSKKCAKPPTSFLVVFEKLMFDLTLPWQYKSKYELLNTYFQIAASVQTRIYAG